MNKLKLTLCTLAAALVTLPALADPTGTIYASGGSRSGKLSWANAKKEYTVTDAKGARVTYAEDSVDRVVVDRPKELDANIKKVRDGSSLGGAIKALEDLAKEYRHLTYDKEATQWLATAYVKQGNSDKAIKACEQIIRDDAEAAYMGAMAVAYWDALIQDGSKGAKLDGLLEKAIASGDTTAAANALLKRGDAILAKGTGRSNYEDALRDGYLRVVLLYADANSDYYPEALNKAANAFDKIGQSSVGNRLRDQLKKDCPTWRAK